MAVCTKCHKWKTRAALSRHKKSCVPSKTDIEHYLISKSGGTRDKKPSV